jgi:chromosome segregation ATPase
VYYLCTQLQDRESEVHDVKTALARSEDELQRLHSEKNNLQSQFCEVQEVCDEAKRSARQHAKDKARLLGQVNDLSTQVRT